MENFFYVFFQLFVCVVFYIYIYKRIKNEQGVNFDGLFFNLNCIFCYYDNGYINGQDLFFKEFLFFMGIQYKYINNNNLYLIVLLI